MSLTQDFTSFFEDNPLTAPIISVWKGATGQTMQEQINQTNADIAEKNLEYQKAFNEQVFNREDTSMQRAKDDAMAAGFSPLAALGNIRGSNAVVSAPQQAITAQSSASVSPASALSAIGNMVSGIKNAVTNAKNADTEQQRVNDIADFNRVTSSLRAKELDVHHSEFLTNYEESVRQFDKNLKQTKDLQESVNQLKRDLQEDEQRFLRNQTELNQSYETERFQKNMEHLNKQLDETVREFNTSKKQKDWHHYTSLIFDNLARCLSSVIMSGGSFFGGSKVPIGFQP